MSAKFVKDTKVYKLAFDQAMEIFEISKRFPKEETYSLTDQIRRSSRSVCICLLEAWRKKIYPAHFVSKVTDSDMEEIMYKKLIERNEKIGKLLHHMINNPDKY